MNRYRSIVQILFFTVISVFAVNHTLANQGITLLPFLPHVSLHAVCPFGGLESAVSLVTGGTLVGKITEATFIISGTVVALTVLLGPVFCAYVCPLGTLQEWVGILGRKLFKKRYNTLIPQTLHRALTYLRYVSLALVLIFTYDAMKLVFIAFDPYFALYHFFTDKAAIGGIVVLGLTLIGSLFVERPWCKYLCPYGAFLGLIGKLSVFKIRRTGSCTSCTRCNRVCPMNIDIAKKLTVSDAQCIRCLKCVSDKSSCPSAALAFTAGSGKQAGEPERP